ncbi:MAG: DNA-3-methyladenine glycosylase family protein [Candidatus Thorarchaeota archaeon]
MKIARTLLSFRIEVPSGYDLLASVHSWIYPDIQPVPEQTGKGYFGRAHSMHGDKFALIIRQSNPGDDLRIDYSKTKLPWSTLKALVVKTLGLGINFDDALKCMAKDEAISHLVSGVAGIRPYMSPTPYEALIKTIIQQQVSYRSANIFTKRMILELTSPITYEGQSWYHFPDATTIAEKGPEGLKEYGFGYKTEYIHGVASRIAEGSLELDSLVGIPYERVLERLKPIHGIGVWTTKVLSLAGLGDFSVFAYDDLVIQKILGKLFNDGQRMNAKQVQEKSAEWGEAGTKVLYLLMSAEVLGLLSSAEKS